MFFSKNGRRVLLVILFFLTIGFVYSFFETYWLKVKEVDIISADIPAAFNNKKIIFLSDIHQSFYFFPKRTAHLVSLVNALNPDLVILGGDYVDKKTEYIIPCFQELKNLKAVLGVWGVLGNHDGKINAPLTIQAMRDVGIGVLDNHAAWIVLGDDKIKIGGVGDYLTSFQDIRPTIGDVQKDDFVILVSHNPDYIGRLNSDKVDLALAGHTHGGQITFFGKKAFLLSYYGNKYLKSPVEEGNMKVLVSNGIGTAGLPLRFFARPEIVLITLKKL